MGPGVQARAKSREWRTSLGITDNTNRSGQKVDGGRSFWLREALGDAPPEPPLRGADRADVAIVGGGYVGIWAAIRIKEKDPNCGVVVLEKDVCGGGASGRN